MLNTASKEEETLPYFAGIDKAKFRRPVQPGDQLKLVCEVIKLKGRVAKVKAEAYVGDSLAAEGRLLFALK
jgi:3-hydroxyacyl-[acyl-carrier-protein] dehydratase